MSDSHRLELIERMGQNAAVAAAIEELKELREDYYKDLARTLHKSSQPIDQRRIDYKRGFWEGAIWALQELPKKATRELEKSLAAALDEGR